MAGRYCIRVSTWTMGPLSLNTHNVVSVFTDRKGVTNILTATGVVYEVKESHEAVVTAMGGEAQA